MTINKKSQKLHNDDTTDDNDQDEKKPTILLIDECLSTIYSSQPAISTSSSSSSSSQTRTETMQQESHSAIVNGSKSHNEDAEKVGSMLAYPPTRDMQTKAVSNHDILLSASHQSNKLNHEPKIKSKNNTDNQNISMNDRLMNAARKRIQRDKEKARLKRDAKLRGEEDNYDMIPSAEHKLQGVVQRNSLNQFNPVKNTTSKSQDQQQILLEEVRGTHTGTPAMTQSDIDTIAYTCLDTFLKEIQDFQSQLLLQDQNSISKTSTNQQSKDTKKHIVNFASFLHEKYIQTSLDRLSSENSTVFKVKKLITTFIQTCRESSNPTKISKLIHNLKKYQSATSSIGSSENNKKYSDKASTANKNEDKMPNNALTLPWNCLICGLKNQPPERHKCSCCGRMRGYKGVIQKKVLNTSGIKKMSYSGIDGSPSPRDPDKEEQEFHSASPYSLNSQEYKEVSTEEKRRKYFLFSKNQYELEAKAKLSEDINSVLRSIRSSL